MISFLSRRSRDGAQPRTRLASRLIDSLGTLVLVISVALMLTVLFGPQLTGLQPYIVLSGSMSPTIPTGSIVFARPVQPATIQVGDVIVFNSSTHAGERVTHRVVQIDRSSPGRPSFTTKGDFNPIPDATPVNYQGLGGKVVVWVPFVGYPLAWIGSVTGKTLLVIVP